MSDTNINHEFTRSTSFDLNNNNNNNTNMETLLSDIRENRTVPCNEWRIFLKQQINSIILQILSSSKYKPHNVPISAIMLDCNSSINDFRNLNPLVPNINKEPSSEDIKGSAINANANSEADAKKDANSNNSALPKVQLGKLGKLINTQVFEFDDWDQIERTNTFKKPPGILAEMIELRKYIERLPERTDLDSLTVLSPFIHIIQSAETSGAVTGAALTSVQYILSNKVLADHSNNLITSIRELSVAVTNCKFEASEPSQDEIVLMRILKVMDVMVQTDIVFDRLATTHIHAIIESALSLCHQIKMSLVFRHHAEQAIQSIILCVISKLISNPQRHFNPAIEALAASDTLIVGADSSTRPSISRSNSVSDAHAAPTFAEVLQDIFKTLIALLDPYSLSHTDYMRLIGISLLHSIFLKDGYLLMREESLRPLICDKLMRNLWILQFGEHLNIVTQSLDLSTLLLSLGLPYMKAQLQLLINQAIQISSPNYQFGNIGKLKQDQIQFLFVNFLLNLFQSSPTFFNELFINYDADIYHQNILEKLVNFIVDNCAKYTTSEFPSQVSNIWLEQILKLLGSMLLRSQDKPQNTLLTRLTGINTYLNRIPPQLYQTDIPQSQHALYSTQTPEQILANKANNQIITQAVEQFNTKPANGIDFLVQNNFLPSKDSENFNLELAKFIKNTPGLDKKKLGEYISKAQNIQILESFLSLFEFNNKRIDEAIRDFLTAFRLPGESQQIDRIMDTFSTYYFNSGPEEFNHRDAVYVISFSVVMLNTDQHSPQVRNKMDFNSYRNNLRGVNDGKNFSDEYLLAIFEGIRDNEIVMPEEHEGQKSLDFIWTSSLQNAQSSGLYYKTTPGQFDEQVFAAIYGIITDLLIQVYKGSLNDSLIQSCLMGLYLVGHLSNGFNNSQALDNLVKIVSSLMARLFSDNEDTDTGFSAQSSSIINRTQMVDNIILSDLAVNLGQSYKAQLATVFLFNLSGDYIANLDSGWWDLLDLLKLFVDSFLLPTDLLTIEEYGFHDDPGSSTSQAKKTSIFIPFSAPDINTHNSNWKSSSETGYIHMQQPSVSTEGSNSGIFSALTSYLGYSSTHPDLIWELPVNLLFAYHDSTKKIIEPCKFKELMVNIQNLNQSKFEALVKKLMIMTRLPQIDSNINDNISRPNIPLSESSDQVTDSSTEPLLQQSSNLDSSSAKYSPSSTFFIHWLVNIALEYHSADRFWPIILTFFADVIYQAEVYHPYIIQRVLVELVNIIFHLTPKSTQSNLAQLSLNKAVQLLGKTSPNSIISSSEQLVPAFKLLIATYSNFLFDSSCWATCLHVAHNTFSSPNPQTVHKTFNLVQQLIGSINHVQVSHGDYLLLVNLLIEYSNPDQFIRSSDDPLQLVIQRSSLSLRLIGKLLEQIPHVAQDRQLSGYYLPPMIGLSNLSNHLRKEIRGAALSQLKYALTSSYLTSQSTFADWSKIFHKVMFPLIDQTISNSHTSGKRQGQQIQQPQMDMIELEEGRTRVSSMLSQVYLVYLNLVSPINPSIDNEESLDSFTHVKNIWTELLPRVLRLMKHPRQNDQYFETIFEIVKNLILVMQATNILLLATDPALEGINTPGYQAKDLESLDQKTQLTITTYMLIKENFPQLMEQLFPTRSLSASPQNMLKIPTVSSENIGNQESVAQEPENEVKAEELSENKAVATNEGDEKEATITNEANTPEPKQELTTSDPAASDPATSQQSPVQKEEPIKSSEDPDQIRDHSAASIILSL